VGGADNPSNVYVSSLVYEYMWMEVRFDTYVDRKRYSGHEVV
jgi:hypothetical protein